MKTGFFLLAMLVYLAIAIEDFCSREIRLLWFLLAFALGWVGLGIWGKGLAYREALLNLGLICLLLGCSWLFCWIKGRRDFWDHYLGKGDAVMLFCLAIWLSPFFLLSLLVLSCLGGSLGLLVIAGLKGVSIQQYPIPLAGILGIGWIISLLLSYTSFNSLHAIFLW